MIFRLHEGFLCYFARGMYKGTRRGGGADRPKSRSLYPLCPPTNIPSRIHRVITSRAGSAYGSFGSVNLPRLRCESTSQFHGYASIRPIDFFPLLFSFPLPSPGFSSLPHSFVIVRESGPFLSRISPSGGFNAQRIRSNRRA